jgi:hypothetical protein
MSPNVKKRGVVPSNFFRVEKMQLLRKHGYSERDVLKKRLNMPVLQKFKEN